MTAVQRLARVTRRPIAAPCEGARCAELDGLLAALSDRGLGSALFADLSIGTWRSHEVARSCFGQLGLAWPLPPAPPLEVGELRAAWIEPGLAGGAAGQQRSASLIGEWIDAEGRGDSASIHALQLAELLHGALGDRPLSLVVLAPRFGLPWRPEDSALLRYLAQGARPFDRLILVAPPGEDPAPIRGLEIRWTEVPPGEARPRPPGLASLVPGAIDAETARLLSVEGHALAGGWALIPPEWRAAPSFALRMEYDRLAAAPVAEGLRAFGQLRGNNHFVDPWFLCSEAIHRLGEGGHGLALELMERAVACARSLPDRAALQALAQGFRISLIRFAEVAGAPDPSPALEPELRGALLMTKGWGLVMSGQAERAEPLMSEARTLLEPRFGAELQYLYLLNISALNHVNLGDLDRALAAERRIEAASAKLAERDGRLDYVNAINIARLHRRRGELEQAALYYHRAFAMTDGVCSESDLVYGEVCMARLDSARDRPSTAFDAWLRAALHWLSADVPEAIGWRVLSAILGRKAMPADTDVEQVAAALIAHLRSSAERAQASIDEVDGAAPPVFVRADRLEREAGAGSFADAEAVGTSRWSVVAMTAPARPALRGAASMELSSLVRALLAAAAPALAACPTFVIDDRLGRGVALGRSDLVGSALRLGVPRARFDAERFDLSPAARRELEDRARPALGPAVARIDEGRNVHFWRYLPPRALTEAEQLLTRACGEAPLSRLYPSLPGGRAEVIALARRLERDRVITLGLELP